jgi:hypothetical protein
MEPRPLARVFGVVGGALFVLAGLIELVVAVAGTILGRLTIHSLVGGVDSALVEVVVGGLVFGFALLGSRSSTDLERPAGAILVVLPVAAWFLIGGSALVAVAGLCSLVAGLLLFFGRR